MAKVEYGSTEMWENAIRNLNSAIDELLDSRESILPSSAEFMIITQLAKQYPAVKSQLDNLMMIIRLVEPDYERQITQMIYDLTK